MIDFSSGLESRGKLEVELLVQLSHNFIEIGLSNWNSVEFLELLVQIPAWSSFHYKF